MAYGVNKVLLYTSDHLLVGAPIGYYGQIKSPPRVPLPGLHPQSQLHLSLSLSLSLFCFTAATLLVVIAVATRLGWFHLNHHPSFSKGTSSLFSSPLFLPSTIYLYHTLIATSSTSTTTLTMSSTAAATPEKAPDDSSKLKTFLSILRKYALPSNSTVTVSTYSIHTIFQPGRYILIR